MVVVVVARREPVFPLTEKIVVLAKPNDEDEVVQLHTYTYTLKSARHYGLLKAQGLKRFKKFPKKFWYSLAAKVVYESRKVFRETSDRLMTLFATSEFRSNPTPLLYYYRPYQEYVRAYYDTLTKLANALKSYTFGTLHNRLESLGYRPSKARVWRDSNFVVHIRTKVFDVLKYWVVEDEKRVELYGSVQPGYTDTLLKSRVLLKMLQQFGGYEFCGYLEVNNPSQVLETKLLFPEVKVSQGSLSWID